MRVLVVCDGNVCRSPMAAEYLRIRASHQRLTHLVVQSGGLLGLEGLPAAAEAIVVAREQGLDLTSHRSRGIRAADVAGADVVLGMTLRHLEELERRFPAGASRRYLLRAFEAAPTPSPGAGEIADPMGEPIDAFRATFATVRTCVDHLVLHLKHLA